MKLTHKSSSMRSKFVAGKLSEILLVILIMIFLEVSHRENCKKIELHVPRYTPLIRFFGNYTPSRSYLDLKKCQNLA